MHLPESDGSVQTHMVAPPVGVLLPTGQAYQSLVEPKKRVRFMKLGSRTATSAMAAIVVLSAIVPQLILLWQPAVGVYATAVSFLSLMLLALCSERARKLAIAAAIYPLTLLITMTLPVSGVFDRTAVFYDVLLLFGLAYALIYALNPPYEKVFSLKTYLVGVPIMAVIGEVLGGVGYGMLRHHYAFKGTIVPLVVVVGVFALAEEVYFRGLLQRQASKVIHPIAALLVTSLVYASASLGHGALLATAFALLSGTVLSTIFYFKQSVFLTTVANMIMKLTYFGLMWTFIFR